MQYVKFDNKKATEYGRIVKAINLGESVIPLAVDELLDYARIDRKMVGAIPYYGEDDVKGEHYLIVAGHFGRQYEMEFMDNPYARPLFISFGIKDFILTSKEIQYFKKNEPILCRDEFSKCIMQKYDIEAYISGCVTVAFNRRINSADRNKYYFVDVKPEFLECVPEEIKEQSVITSQNVVVENVSDKIMEWGENCAVQRLEEYSSKAKMIITSKLHCMTPCVAMGIPTIAVGNNFAYRYSFVDAFIKSYNLDEFKKYNWEIPLPDKNVEYVRKLFLDVGKSMLLEDLDMAKVRELDLFYSKRKRWNYLYGIKKKLSDIYNENRNKKIIIWGASSGGYSVVSCIKCNWSDWEVCAVIDSYAEGEFAGLRILRPDYALKTFSDAIVIISTISGRKMAEDYMRKYDKNFEEDYFIIHESI